MIRFGPPYLIALAIAFVVWRRRLVAPSLPDLRGLWSPVAVALLAALLVVSSLLTYRGFQQIDVINKRLPSGVAKSQELEWVWSPAAAAREYAKWKDAGQLANVRAGVDVDTYSFIPFYPFAFFAASLLVARLLPPQSRLYGWGVVIAWLALVAGAFDFAENCGIVHELRGGRWFRLAPLTASFALVKWVLLAMNVLFIVGALVAGAARFARRVF